ncbi:MAG TPA: hypothetical protein VIT89_01880 [Solirubrobacterales bacterium]
MKYTKLAVLAAFSVTALMGLGAVSASATTFEAGGSAKNEAIAITASLQPGTTLVMSNTPGWFANKCTASHMQGATTSPFTGPTVSTHLTTLTIAECTAPVTVHKPGTLEVVWSNGTSGTVFAEGTQLTVTISGTTIFCAPGKTHFGTLTGVASGHATLDVNAVVNCGFLLPSLKVEAKYIVTSPTGLGVTS